MLYLNRFLQIHRNYIERNYTVWSLWIMRNAIVFKDGALDIVFILDSIQVRSWHWIKTKEVGNEKQIQVNLLFPMLGLVIFWELLLVLVCHLWGLFMLMGWWISCWSCHFLSVFFEW